MEVNHSSSGQYSINKNIGFIIIRFNIRSYLCDYSDAYIIVKWTIDLLAVAANENDKAEKDVAFKNNAPFGSCISKINSTEIDNTEDLDIVIRMYNLLEYSQNYSRISGSLWNYYRDEIDDVDDNASDGKLFEYKTKLVGNTPERPGNEGYANRPPVHVEVTIPLKYLSNFWRSLDWPLINCEIELDLSWTKDCALIEKNNNIAGVNFVITSTKLYVPVVTLSINDNIKFLENIKQGFKRTVSWNKYRSEITAQPKNNNLDYLIDPTFRIINRLFALSFKTGNDDPSRDYVDKYYMPLVEIKDFNALIDNKLFYDQPVNNKQEAYEKLFEMPRNDDYTTENLLDYLYHENYYKLIGIDLSRQTNTKIPQQINFIGKLKEDEGATMFFIAEKLQKIILNFSLNSLIVSE